MALAIRKLANRDDGERVVRFDPTTGEKKLVNPATPGEDHEPWPLAGVEFVGDPPQKMTVPVDFIDRAVAEGWVTRKNETAVVRPAGPTQDVWASSHTGTPHTFIQAEEIVFHMVDGDHRYKVVQNPDKYAIDGVGTINEDKGLYNVKISKTKKVTPELYKAGQTVVTWTYELERVDG